MGGCFYKILTRFYWRIGGWGFFLRFAIDPYERCLRLLVLFLIPEFLLFIAFLYFLFYLRDDWDKPLKTSLFGSKFNRIDFAALLILFVKSAFVTLSHFHLENKQKYPFDSKSKRQLFTPNMLTTVFTFGVTNLYEPLTLLLTNSTSCIIHYNCFIIIFFVYFQNPFFLNVESK